MTDTLSLGWSRADADRKITTYRRLLGLALILQTAIAVAFLFWPGWALSIIGLDAYTAGEWPRVWAGMLLLANLFQIPAWRDPVHQRFPNVVAVTGRALMVVIYLALGGGFLWFALFDGLFCLLLGLTYHRLVIAELMTRP